MSAGRYELVDFGAGRKLESLAGHLIDRPCVAAANHAKHAPGDWSSADARFDAHTSRWSHRRPWPEGLAIQCGVFQMPVRPTPFGHIGVFPEQIDNWSWLGQRRRFDSSQSQPPQSQPLALNLFGYTGASTIALVLAGYAVAHVDASKPSVQAVREVAMLNGHPEAKIRYLVDDASKFAAREVRRGRKYDTIVLDPPAYGHAPGGKAWRLQRDLWPLLDHCLQLIRPDRFRMLITGHSPEVDQNDVSSYLRQSAVFSGLPSASALLVDSGRSQLRDSIGRPLDAGFYVRVSTGDDRSLGFDSANR